MKPMEINVMFDEGAEGAFDSEWLAGIARRALGAEDVEEDADMGLVIATDRRVQELNKTYRGKDSTTDVLSFPFSEDAEGECSFPAAPDGIRHLGEIILSYPQAQRQAAEHSHSIKREAAILIIHGVLHLLGYDHIEDDEAEVMEAREAEILKIVEARLA
jgi:probable rRNA maturation factor